MTSSKTEEREYLLPADYLEVAETHASEWTDLIKNDRYADSAYWLNRPVSDYVKWKHSLCFPSQYLDSQGICGVFVPSDDKQALPGGYLAFLYMPCRESNLELYYISVEGTHFKKSTHIIGEMHAQEEWYNLILQHNINRKDLSDQYLSSGPGYPRSGEEMLATTDEWYPPYEGGLVSASLWRNRSNLELWQVHLGGADDYSISKDFLSESEARAEWRRLLKMKDVRKDNLSDYYFSN